MALASVVTWKTVDNWWEQDNHLFLLNYFCIATVLSLGHREPRRMLAANAKLLLGLSFLFATLWKGLLSPDFMSGSYFYYSFLTDRRFEWAATLFAGMPATYFEQNRRLLASLQDTNGTVESVTFLATPELRTFTTLVTWWTIAIECALALAFLWPGTRGPARYRHIILLLFAWTTYTTVTNVGVSFGWVLMTLGVAQCEPGRRHLRLLYVATCCLLLAYNYLPLFSFIGQAMTTARDFL